ncbi:hypothetical protein Lqui_1649 [Legionella quinlivanii]|uniref:Uncharacterized protein n=1 Tax=Legionella quinlivanii TaxID=45073 RepID=A0A0W0Y141_9GAMM|nr:hypothetical protein [Legionella quinlivanii]KTD50324.1 hypothetical protein Lqui_1649 [Legionella quinlivanii]MCW8449929.1 hypothetical protein [Legionella quinlivanii]SEF43483.1 hypothetical protein SAMN02746093_00179 [Legionella quinlivanii DSM 21216]STY11924.1 Uncharacterised protein [Legionella quinlivanii]
MLPSEYKQKLEEFRKHIFALPTTELKYHLFLLLAAIEPINTPQTRDILVLSIDLTAQCKDFLNPRQRADELQEQIELVNIKYGRLVKLIDKYNSSFVLYPHLLTIGSALLAITLGLFFAILGGITGVVQGIINQQNPLKYFALGTFVGLCLGGAIGNRTPEYLLEEPLFRKLKLVLDGLNLNLNQLTSSRKTIHDYLNEVLEDLLVNYFDNDKEKLNHFLNSPASYTAGSHPAEFVSEHLRGYVGQHALIAVKIADKPPFALEFAISPSDLTRELTQPISRQTTGRKIAEMMALHRQMQETHACTLHYMTNHMKPGETDCLAYVLRLTDGVNEPRPPIKRFYQQNSIGNFLSFFISHLSAFSEKEEQSMGARPASGQTG